MCIHTKLDIKAYIKRWWMCTDGQLEILQILQLFGGFQPLMTGFLDLWSSVGIFSGTFLIFKSRDFWTSLVLGRWEAIIKKQGTSGLPEVHDNIDGTQSCMCCKATHAAEKVSS